MTLDCCYENIYCRNWVRADEFGKYVNSKNIIYYYYDYVISSMLKESIVGVPEMI